MRKKILRKLKEWESKLNKIPGKGFTLAILFGILAYAIHKWGEGIIANILFWFFLICVIGWLIGFLVGFLGNWQKYKNKRR